MRKMISFFYLAILSIKVQAQTGINGAQIMTLPQAIQSGMKNNSQLKVSETRTQIAESKLQQVKDKALPQAGTSLQYSRLNILSDFGLYMGGEKPVFKLPVSQFDAMVGVATVNKEIFGGFAERSALRSNEYLIQASKLDAEKDAEEVKFNIIAAYLNIFKIAHSENILEENVRLLDKKEKEVKDLFKEGVVTTNEVLKIQLQHSNLELTKVDIRNIREIALHDFSILIGASEGVPIDIDTNISLEIRQVVPVDDLISFGLEHRIELKAMNFREKSGQAMLKQVKSAYYPHFDVSGMYIFLNQSPNKDIIPSSGRYLNATNLGVSLKYNISSLYGMKGRTQEMRLNIIQVHNNEVVIEEKIKSEVFAQYKTYKSAIEKIEVSKTAEAQAVRSYQLSDSKFRNGLLLSSDLIESQNLLLQSQLNILQAKVDAQIAWYRLQKAIGSAINNL